MSGFAGRVALVTGAGSGIGRAIALTLAERGATVWLAGSTGSKLEETAARAQGQTVCVTADLSRDADIQRLTARCRAEARGLDVLVHSAGVFALGPVETAPVEDLDRQYQVNLRAPYVLTQALLPLLRERRGQVVFVNSSAGLAAAPNVSQYAVTKFGLKALADSLRGEVNASGIRVLSVFPGRTATPMGQAVHALEGKSYDGGRLVQPEDVAMAVVEALLLPATAEITDLVIRPLQKP